MDGRSRRFYSRTPRKPALQLRPQPRFVAPPPAPGLAVNVVRPFVRPIPTPINPVTAVPTAVIPRLGLLGLAFGVGFFIGDAIINPLLGRRRLFDWGLFNTPEDPGAWLNQDPLPSTMTVRETGQMGTSGAWVTSTMTYGDSRVDGDGCTAPITRTPGSGSRVKVTSSGGQLQWRMGGESENACGQLSYSLYVLRTTPSNPDDAQWKVVQSITTSNWDPKGGMTFAEFDVEFEPDGDPLETTPLPAWSPEWVIPKPEVEPLPQVEPETQPQRTPLMPPAIPMAPPAITPLTPPQVLPPIPAPAPAPVTPSTPTPLPTIPNIVPQPVPNYSKQLFPWQNTPNPDPNANNIVPTDKNSHFVQKYHFPGGTGRSSLNYIAQEVNRIEQKMAKSFGLMDLLPIILGILELLQNSLIYGTRPGTTYTLQGICEDVEDGEDQPQEDWEIPERLSVDAVIARVDVLAEMLQTHLGYRTPTCASQRPQLEGDWRTISFISDETSPYGKSRLRKRFRYRSLSGLGLGEVIDHWADFTWEAGPVIVQHTGASWGSPKVWAASIDEGKRVIRHAAGESGIDPDQVGQWSVSGSSSTRVGVSGTMRVNQKGGFYWITARDGSENRPTVGRV